MKLREFVDNNKKLMMTLGFLFIICLQCCVFPAVNRAYRISDVIVLINFVTAVGVCKCAGELEAFFFQNASWGQILFINFILTLLGMGARYLLEYGEVSNTYNFTARNMLLHIVMMVLWSSAFWKSGIREKKSQVNES